MLVYFESPSTDITLLYNVTGPGKPNLPEKGPGEPDQPGTDQENQTIYGKDQESQIYQ